MIESQNDIFARLKEKIFKVIELYRSEKEKNQKLIHENNELIEKIKTCENKLNNIHAKYDTLKIAKSLIASSEDTHDAKIKVNRMVREIDKCIALLNR